MHHKKILHLDLKPNNLLWNPNENVVQIIDFGMSHFLNEQPKHDSYMAQAYRAPELRELESVPLASKRTFLTTMLKPSVDYWCFGCIATEVLTGKIRFPTDMDMISFLFDF